jgi:hypothetical protein
MRLAYLFAFALAGCVVPAQQPTYFQGNGPPPPSGAQAGAPAAAASCQDTVACYGQCNPLTDPCVNACDQRTTPDSVQNAHALVQCMAQSGCQDQNCVAQQCGAQITTCTGATLTAQAGGGATSPAPPAGGGPGPDEVMTPQFSYGSLVVPPPDRQLTQADLAGEWDQGAGTVTNYADASTGNYTGYRSIQTATHWSIDGDGKLVEKWRGATTSSTGGAHGMSEDSTGSTTMLGNNTIRISRDPNQYHQDVQVQDYIVVGWFQGQDQIVMEIQGPYSDPPTQDDYANVKSNSYRNDKYARKR